MLEITQKAIDEFWKRVDKDGPIMPGMDSACWLWIGSMDGSGYGSFKLKGQRMGAHRFSSQLHHGPIPPGLHVLHQCDNPPCCNPYHTFRGTNGDNIRDRNAKGRGPEVVQGGERNGNAKLTEAQVIEIRRRYAAGGISQTRLGAEFGVSNQLVSRIVACQLWPHVLG